MRALAFLDPLSSPPPPNRHSSIKRLFFLIQVGIPFVAERNPALHTKVDRISLRRNPFIHTSLQFCELLPK